MFDVVKWRGDREQRVAFFRWKLSGMPPLVGIVAEDVREENIKAMKSAIELFISQKVKEYRLAREWPHRYLGDCSCFLCFVLKAEKRTVPPVPLTITSKKLGAH